LVLSRRENESIVIDGRIKVTVVRVSGDKIRLGIEAPKEVAVWRSELIESSVVIGPFVVQAPESLAMAH
jgi:carbon storage regulator